MKVLYVCAELYPLLKTGGLADVSAALPVALQAAGCDVRLLLPGFGSVMAGVDIEGEATGLPKQGGPDVLHNLSTPARLVAGRVRESGQAIFLLDAPELFQREGGPYGDARGAEWPDNAARFAALCWAAACLGQGASASWRPDVLHCHDWHTGLVPVYLKLLAEREALNEAGQPGAQRPPACVFTIHNLAYQGIFPSRIVPLLGLPWSLFNIDGYEFYDQLSFMKAGLQFADAITTVSPRYAQEITTPEQGCGLDGVLRERSLKHRAAVSGILNGVDYGIWSPAADTLLATPFDVGHMAGKAEAKCDLQRHMGLAPHTDALVFAVVSRLTEQKGFHLLPAVVDELVAQGGQLVMLGSGDAGIEQALQEASARHPGHAVLRVGYDEALAHRIMAGADVLLVPSRYEPCGLTQLYAMRYGTLPLVHGVGGLADTVTDATADALAAGTASGIVFHTFTEAGLREAVVRAFSLHDDEAMWARLQQHMMGLRFAWADAANAYRSLYQTLDAAASKLTDN